MTFAVPGVDARLPRAKAYHVHGPITLDTNLLSTSGVSAWAIDEYLQAKTSLPRLGAAFLAAERKHGVNARFLLAAAMHELAWGRGAIARLKHNLFGYNAYDRDPFHYATAYATYAANINATAKFIRDFYLTPGGRWWGGQPTLRSMQQFWSSSGQWGINVSRIATSIHLDAVAGRSIKVSSPAVSSPLHGGDRATVELAWTGGAIPSGVRFVATWQPVELPADGPGTPVSPSASGDAAALDTTSVIDPTAAADVASSSSTAWPATDAPDPAARETVDARRAQTRSRSITLSVPVPDRPGGYALQVEMRDTDRRTLPRAQRVRIPTVDIRVWDDRAVSVELERGIDGTGGVLTITNTGREAIPSEPDLQPNAAAAPDAEALRSVITVTAIAGGPTRGTPITLLTEPLAADLLPGGSVSVDLPAIDQATGRAANWLSVGLSVLGNPTWLAASAPIGAWYPAPAAVNPSGDAPSAPDLVVDGERSQDQTPSPASPTPAPTATPAPSAAATPSNASSGTAAPKPVKRHYSEGSRRIVYRGSWGNASSSGYIGGNVRYSKTAGSTATFTFTGSSVRWIGPLGPTRGRALVLIDGRAVARVDLWRSSFVARAVLFTRSFKASGKHSLTIKVLSTPGRPYVAIDQLDIKP